MILFGHALCIPFVWATAYRHESVYLVIGWVH